MKRKPNVPAYPWYSYIIATMGGIGYAPLPGTFATIVTAYGAWVTHDFVSHHWHVVSGILAIVCFVSLYAINTVLEHEGSRDPSYIVIDEGIATVLMVWALPHNAVWVISAVCIFRFFDSTKYAGLHLVELLDRGWGVLADDIFAALYTLGLIYVFDMIYTSLQYL